MNVIIIVGIFVALLFALAYFTKRRFGVLGLALTAGAVLSDTWSTQLVPYVRQAGLEITAPPLESVLAVVVILAPAVILLFSGPTYSKKVQRIIGAAAFALLAVAFMVQPLGDALVLNAESTKVYEALMTNRHYIITAGILFAVVDLLSAKSPKHSKKHDKEH